LSFVAALKFLTILPAYRHRESTPQEISRSIVFFPLVGAIIGLILAGSYWLLRFVFPAAVISGLLLVGIAVLSGGLHLDGFVDTIDGIGGHKTATARWQVMRDSRAGAFGIAGVFLLLILKYAALNSIADTWMMSALLVMPVVSRWLMVYAICAYPYARPSGLGKVFKDGASWGKFIVATLITLAITVPLFRWASLAIILGSGAITLAMAHFLKRKFAGLTGDTYGAINEVAEVSVLAIVSLLAYNHWLGLV
jgi:adenosylcobinamide-GDP ribazoletransferase